MALLYARVARTPLRTSFRSIRPSRPAIFTFSTSSYRAELNEGDRGMSTTQLQDSSVDSTPRTTPRTTTLQHDLFSPADTTPVGTLADSSTHEKGREDVAEHYEMHKQEQLKEQKEGKGKWRKEIASNSEQAVGLIAW